MITNKPTTDTNLEATLLKSLLVNTGINVKNNIIKDFNDDTIVGFFCTASSLIRKATTVTNLQNFIKENELPLVVKGAEDNNVGFKVMIVEQPEPLPAYTPSISELKHTLSLATNYLTMAEICENNISRGVEVDWWKEKKVECLTMYQTLTKAI